MKRYFIIFILTFLLIAAQKDQVIYASSGIAEIEDFNDLDGDAKYLGDDYRDNYTLDIEKTGIMDSAEKWMNNIANVFFSMLRVAANIVCSIFYFSMDFDITDILGNQIDKIQTALKSSIFTPLFTLAFAGTSVVLVKRMFKRDISGTMSEIFKVLGIVVLSVAVVNNSSTVLSNTTTITKSICTDVLTNMNSNMDVNGGSGASYAASSAGVLWVNFIHEPWKSLEFGNSDPDQDTIDKFLSSKDGSDDRKDLVKDYESNHEGTFDKHKGATRIGMIVIYSIPFYVKAAIYLAVALLQLIFQLLALFFVLTACVVLILAMIPGYEGIISTWLKKILETQVSILILTILMALMIKLDVAFYDLIPTYGWSIGIVFQTALSIGLFLGRNKILHAFSNMQRGVTHPGYMKMRMMRAGNVYNGIENARNTVRKVQISRINTKSTSTSGDDKVAFVMNEKEKSRPTTTNSKSSGKNSENSGSKKTVKPECPVIQSQATQQPVQSPDRVATPTTWQIDTGNIHEMWENSVSKEQLNNNQVKSSSGISETPEKPNTKKAGDLVNNNTARKMQRPVMTPPGAKMPAENNNATNPVKRKSVQRPVSYMPNTSGAQGSGQPVQSPAHRATMKPEQNVPGETDLDNQSDPNVQRPTSAPTQAPKSAKTTDSNQVANSNSSNSGAHQTTNQVAPRTGKEKETMTETVQGDKERVQTQRPKTLSKPQKNGNNSTKSDKVTKAPQTKAEETNRMAPAVSSSQSQTTTESVQANKGQTPKPKQRPRSTAKAKEQEKVSQDRMQKNLKKIPNQKNHMSKGRKAQ